MSDLQYQYGRILSQIGQYTPFLRFSVILCDVIIPSRNLLLMKQNDVFCFAREMTRSRLRFSFFYSNLIDIFTSFQHLPPLFLPTKFCASAQVSWPRNSDRSWSDFQKVIPKLRRFTLAISNSSHRCPSWAKRKWGGQRRKEKVWMSFGLITQHRFFWQNKKSLMCEFLTC